MAKRSIRVFVDSDVVISSLLSSSGAAYLLLNHIEIELFISNFSCQELKIVAERLDISVKKLEFLLESRFKVIQLSEELAQLEKQYSGYTFDLKDAHIVAGAKIGKVQFLATYNTKHFGVDKIKKDLGIILVTPANLIQYLRSL
jgi:predicted nucleic acid-binding protein